VEIVFVALLLLLLLLALGSGLRDISFLPQYTALATTHGGQD